MTEDWSLVPSPPPQERRYSPLSEFALFQEDTALSLQDSRFVKGVAKEQELIIVELRRTVAIHEATITELKKRERDLRAELYLLPDDKYTTVAEAQKKLVTSSTRQEGLLAELSQKIDTVLATVSSTSTAEKMEASSENDMAVVPFNSSTAKLLEVEPPSHETGLDLAMFKVEIKNVETNSIGVGTHDHFPLKEPPETCSIGVGTEDELLPLVVPVVVASPKVTCDIGVGTGMELMPLVVAPTPPKEMKNVAVSTDEEFIVSIPPPEVKDAAGEGGTNEEVIPMEPPSVPDIIVRENEDVGEVAPTLSPSGAIPQPTDIMSMDEGSNCDSPALPILSPAVGTTQQIETPGTEASSVPQRGRGRPKMRGPRELRALQTSVVWPTIEGNLGPRRCRDRPLATPARRERSSTSGSSVELISSPEFETDQSPSDRSDSGMEESRSKRRKVTRTTSRKGRRGTRTSKRRPMQTA